MVTEVDLLNILEDLIERELKKFKWYLQQSIGLEKYQAIPRSQLENADTQDTVDVMVQTYQLPGAVEVTKKLLKTINRNDLLQSLPDIISGPEDFSELTVDQNKLKRFVKLPDDNNRTERCLTKGPDQWSQLMWTEGLTDHSYWEFKWRGWGDISLTYREIRGKGNIYDYTIGQNDQSRNLSGSDDEGNRLAQKEKNTPAHLILILLLINLFLLLLLLLRL